MKGLIVNPGMTDTARVADIPQPILTSNQALLEPLLVGIDGTDREINNGSYGAAPQDTDYLIMGHETVAVISGVEEQVFGFAKGDLVVPTVRRPCRPACTNCAVGEMGACLSGQYEEHGIRKLHGFAAQYAVSDAEFLVKVPPELKDIAILLEPLSIAERAISQIYRMQERFTWKPKNAFVLGAGPLGLLTTIILRLRGLEVYCGARDCEDSIKADIVTSAGGIYHNTADNPIKPMEGSFDIVVDATGSAEVVVDSAHLVGLNGVFCFLGIYQEQDILQNTGRALTKMVLGNRIMMGSVNSDKKDFELGLADMAEISKKYPSLLSRLITEKLPLDEYKRAFEPSKGQIKQIIELRN